jgi:hypothetical protein
MRPSTAARVALGLLLAGAAAGCGGDQPARQPATPTTVVAAAATTEPPRTAPPKAVSRADAARCPVTKPGKGPPDVSPDAFFGWEASYGNGKLWVGALWEGGVIAADSSFIDEHGAVSMKFGWWRKTEGKLRITGHRVDAAAPPARGDAPDGYGPTGFQASGVTFPTEGCWEITGDVGTASLTFTTFVIKEP